MKMPVLVLVFSGDPFTQKLPEFKSIHIEWRDAVWHEVAMVAAIVVFGTWFLLG